MTASRSWTVGLVSALSAVLVVSMLAAIALGSSPVPFGEMVRYLWAALVGGSIEQEDATAYQIIWQIRTPRVVLAAVVGAGLSVVGVAIQATVRNALADPFVLGISSGASVGAVAVTVFGALSVFGVYAVSAGAFVGASATAVIVYAMAHGRGGVTPLRLVLVGVALSFGFQALMSVIVYLAPSGEATSAVLYWSMGGFGAASWGTLPVVAAMTLLGIVLLRSRSRLLDVLALGDESAVSLGVNVARMRRWLFVVTSLVTGAMVAVSGAIGFVGLVMPHLVRMLVGAVHSRVLAVSPLVGAVFMIWVDLLARTMAAPRELPIGVLTALVGVPVFVVLLRRRGYLFEGRR